MTKMTVVCELERPVEMVEQLLLRQDLLDAFVEKQKPWPEPEN
jgi:hypothetical protein